MWFWPFGKCRWLAFIVNMVKNSGSKEQYVCMTELKHSHAFWTQLHFWRSHGGLWKVLAPESPRRYVAISLYASTEVVETGEGLCLCSLWQRTAFFNRKMTKVKCPFPTSGICSEANILLASRKLRVRAYLSATANVLFSEFRSGNFYWSFYWRTLWQENF